MTNIKIDFSNVMADAIGSEHGISPDELKAMQPQLEAAHNKILENWKKGELGFLNLPDDKSQLELITPMAKGVRYQYSNLVILGIGGSALGTRFLANSLLPPFYNLLESKGRDGCPRLFVCDNVDPDNFGALLDMLDLKNTCINVVSKSGKTVETASQFFLVKEMLIKKFGSKKWTDHIVITTDPLSGPLRTMAVVEHLKSLPVPLNVGGRFSVLSSVGLFPAACVGIDIEAMLAGARAMRDACFADSSVENNYIYKNGAIHYLMDTKKKKNVSVMMPYSDGLNLFSDWYAQIWAESIGKDGKGTTPVKALGVTDQHSQLQLFMEGPNDKVTTILGVEKFGRSMELPSDINEPFQYLKGHTLTEVLHAEQTSTCEALKAVNRPNLTVTLPEINAHTVGELIMLYEIQTAFTGYLYGINPFNQPGVELGKKLTREKLA